MQQSLQLYVMGPNVHTTLYANCRLFHILPNLGPLLYLEPLKPSICKPSIGENLCRGMRIRKYLEKALEKREREEKKRRRVEEKAQQKEKAKSSHPNSCTTIIRGCGRAISTRCHHAVHVMHSGRGYTVYLYIHVQ